jgi:thiol-disulfide isomerase/thioredoxin
VAAVLLLLWQAGAIFEDAGTTAGGNEPQLLAANAGLPTSEVPGRSVGLNEGDVAPNFEFYALDGRRLSLEEFRGQAVFVNFWATWCAPCKVEMPHMEALLDAYGSQGLVVLAINNGDRLAQAQRFIDELGVEFSAVGYDPDANIARRYGLYGMPTSFFIDRTGVITRVAPGQLSYSQMESAARTALGVDAAAP